MTSREEAVAALTAPGAIFQMAPTVIEGVPWRIYTNAPPSFRAIFESTKAFGDRPFLVYEDDRCTFADHYGIVAGFARWLAERGIGKGDRVAIGARNYPEWSMAFWSAQVLGAIAVPLNAWWTGPELEYALRDSGAAALVMDGERLERVEAFLAALELKASVVVRHDGPVPTGTDRWSDVLAAIDRTPELPAAEVGPDDLATIMYTSGTTGLPKGALATQRNHATNLMNTMFNGALNAALAPPSPEDTPTIVPPPPAALQVFPFFHIGGLSGLYIFTAFGGKLVTMYKWDTELALEILEREEITATAMVPTLLRQLLESPSITKRHLDRLGGLSSGGAPVPPDLIRTLESTFESKVSPANGYGLTETTSAVIMNSGQEYFRHPDSIGRLTPVTDLMVVNADGEALPPGEIGELWLRGPNVVKGYWNKPEATAAAFTEGWFHSGDLGYQDGEGFVYVVDRLKDVVIRGGENVYCAEVEAILFEHPAVADVAIVGLPHAVLGEEVAAVVLLRPGMTPTADEIVEFVGRRLARFKAPTRVFFDSEPLPRTATGKVLKRELRDKLTAGS